MPTITELLETRLRNYFKRPEVIEQMKPLEETFQKVVDFCTLVGTALQRVADSPPSFGYEPWLMENTRSRLAARGIAHLIVRHGNRRANDSKRLFSVVSALRFLAKPRRNKPARDRRITLLLAAMQGNFGYRNNFCQSRPLRIRVHSFARIEPPKGNEDAYLRITEIAASLSSASIDFARALKLVPHRPRMNFSWSTRLAG